MPTLTAPRPSVSASARTAGAASWRVYEAQPSAWGAPERWPAELDRIAALGVTALLIPSPFWRGSGRHADADPQASADLQRADAALREGPVDGAVHALVKLCRARGLALWIDVPLLRAAVGSLLANALAQGSPPAAAAVRDPRRPVDPNDSVPWPWHDATARPRLLALAHGAVQPLLAAGVRGLRCDPFDPLLPTADALAAMPPWQTLIDGWKAAAPDTTVLAWTAGLAPAQLQALNGAGFDGACSSLPWWDYRAPWLQAEQARLRPLGAILAMPEAPDAARLGAPGGDTARLRRALWTATTTGDGLLIPMGFEFGVRRPLQRRAPLTAAQWDALRAQSSVDVSDEIRRATGWLAERGNTVRGLPWQAVTSPDAPLTVLRRGRGADASVLAVNPSADHAGAVPVGDVLVALGAAALVPQAWSTADTGPALDATATLSLGPAGWQLFNPQPATPVLGQPARGPADERNAVEQLMTEIARVVIEAVTPAADGGRFAVRRVVGERVRVEADVWIDGHDQLAVHLLWRAADEAGWHEVPMHHVVNDRWAAEFPLARLGRHVFTVEAWRDAYGSWAHDVAKKRAAGVAQAVDVAEGRALLQAACGTGKSRATKEHKASGALLATLVKQLGRKAGADAATVDTDLACLLDPATVRAMASLDERPHAARHAPELPVEAERLAARYASWYELFPRSQGPDDQTHGTFDDVIAQLPRVRDMGFDVLYFPPIHPIGTAHRKGRNNSLTAGPDDPGSPYAIGSPDGGHDAIHPQLGTLDDFRRLRDAAKDHGLELALDFAVQCSPDHPWLKEHPEWFAFRADGTLRYAENPPKKYEDITNVDFYNAADAPGLWLALRDVLLFWAREGVTIIRVDNPHTKPLPFWEWVIAEVRAQYPQAMFLAEAFTRPKMMARLAKLGFSQSYSYFTWRNTKGELTEYLTELTQTGLAEYFRPHFFVNTPDINPYFLQRSGRPGFLIRAALAATLSGLWGVYSGFEVCEGAAHVVGGVVKEEYADSEKYQFRRWDWAQPGNIVAEITRLNMIRRENPALQTHLNVAFYKADDDQVLYFAKATRGADGRFSGNVLLVAINLDPFNVHEPQIELPLWEWGLPDHAALHATDLMHGHDFVWHGKQQRVRLDPHGLPFAIWRVRPA